MTATRPPAGAETLRSRVGRLAGAGVWLVFLGNPLQSVLQHDAPLLRAVGLGALLAFAGIYLRAISQVRRIHAEGRYAAALTYVALELLCFALIVPAAGDRSMSCLVFVAATSVALLPRRWAVLAVVGLFAGSTAAGTWVDGWLTHGNNFAVLLAAAAVYSFRLAFQRADLLAQAEREIAELALEEERSRIGRDLHDILGHSLTVIAVKADLAARMAETDPAGAQAELEDLMRLSRDALADVRSTARGMRGISLPGEIASARAALDSAGIEAELPTVADEVPTDLRELFAWALREGVTNVIRHSDAAHCTVDVSPRHIRVTDDGHGDPCSDPGTGLEGLRHRARSHGATVTTSSPSGGGFSLMVAVRP